MPGSLNPTSLTVARRKLRQLYNRMSKLIQHRFTSRLFNAKTCNPLVETSKKYPNATSTAETQENRKTSNEFPISNRTTSFHYSSRAQLVTSPGLGATKNALLRGAKTEKNFEIVCRRHELHQNQK